MAPDALSLHDWTVLGLVAVEPRHGFALARELAATGTVGRVWTVPRPQVYRSLDHLRAGGLVRPLREEAGAGGPARTVFAATATGRRRLDGWIRAPVDHLRDVRTAFLVKATLAAPLGVHVATLASAQRAHVRPLLDNARAGDAAGRDLVARWRAASAAAIDEFLAGLERTAGDEPE